MDTVRRFKGLERPLVIVHLDEDVTSTSELTYVALTRARSLLVVVGTPAHLAVAKGIE